MRLQGLFVAFMLCASSALASPIFHALPETLPTGYSGFWLGAMELQPGSNDIGPDGLDRMVVAQTFTTFRDFSDIVGAIALASGTDVAAPPKVTLTLAVDAGDAPGQVLATTTIAVTSSALRLYDFALTGVTLTDATRYWLIATSDAVRYLPTSPGCCVSGLPVWATYDLSAERLASSQNGAPWVFQDASLMLSLEGTDLGDSVPNGTPIVSIQGNPTAAVPEPPALALLGVGLLAGARVRRRAG